MLHWADYLPAPALDTRMAPSSGGGAGLEIDGIRPGALAYYPPEGGLVKDGSSDSLREPQGARSEAA